MGSSWQVLRATHPEADWLAPAGMHPDSATTALMALRIWREVAERDHAGPPCVSGLLFVHAPSESGFFHVNRLAHPHTCLVPETMVRALAGRP